MYRQKTFQNNKTLNFQNRVIVLTSNLKHILLISTDIDFVIFGALFRLKYFILVKTGIYVKDHLFIFQNRKTELKNIF